MVYGHHKAVGNQELFAYFEEKNYRKQKKMNVQNAQYIFCFRVCTYFLEIASDDFALASGGETAPRSVATTIW